MPLLNGQAPTPAYEDEAWRRLARGVAAMQEAGMFDAAWKFRVEAVLLGRHSVGLMADIIEQELRHGEPGPGEAR